jgi:hypothetical protein
VLLFLALGSMSFLTKRKISSIASAILFNCVVSIYILLLSHIIYDNYGRIMAIRVKKRYDARQNVAAACGLWLGACGFFYFLELF